MEKGLNIEEKAKAYDEALSRAREEYLDGIQPVKESIEYIFSEIKESGDEKSEGYKFVEPKFKVGDWIVVGGFPLLICDMRSNTYETIINEHRNFDIDVLDKVAHLWTIKDAKDGDVLACESGWTCIFKTLVNEETFSSYCFMDSITGWFCELGSECHTLKEEFVKAYNGKIQPATKEQRELLFQKMKEEGYKWDYETKKPIKI